MVANDTQLTAAYTIHCQHQYKPWSQIQFEQSNSGTYECVVGVLDNSVVGYLIIQTVIDEVTVIDIAVEKKHRGYGIGKALLLDMFQRHTDKNIYQYLLEVRVSNVAAIQLYQQLGFAITGTRRNYYPSETGSEDALLMNKVGVAVSANEPDE